MISRTTIEKLNPCKDRLDNYIKHYGDRKFTPNQFMGLKNITHKDKLWVAFRILDRKSIALVAADIAESVLNIYEAKHPNDKRPRKCIEATRLYVAGKITIEQLQEKRTASASAADAAYADAAYADAAYAAADAAYAAADAAYAAAASAADADVAKVLQEKLIRKILLKYWREHAMKYYFELHDDVLDQCISRHTTFKGAAEALINDVKAFVTLVIPDYEDQYPRTVDTNIRYHISVIEVKEN